MQKQKGFIPRFSFEDHATCGGGRNSNFSVGFNGSSKSAGFIAILASVLVVLAMTTVALAVSNMVLADYRVSGVSLKSLQAYFAAESGIEDAILRTRNDETLPANYSFSVGDSIVDMQITGVIGGSITIQSIGEDSGVFKKMQAVQSLNSANIQFFFGAQVGDGGLTMNGNSTVEGNVFSNGTIMGAGGGSQDIIGSVVVAKNGNKIENITVKKDALGAGGNASAHTCKNSVIEGELSYVSGGSMIGCVVGEGVQILPNDIDPLDLPIDLAQITTWQDQAEAGGVYSGNYVMSNFEVASLGPLKIDGDLIMTQSTALTLTGVVWVTGNIDLANTASIVLDEGIFGFQSGVIIANGTVNLGQNISIDGTGKSGSYLMVLTTNSGNPAMTVANSSNAGVFYASEGFILVSNNTVVREVTAFGLTLNNNVTLQYEVGLANLFFSSGPGSGWQIDAWGEIE